MNPTAIKELVLSKHEVNYLSDFKSKIPFNFIPICLKAIADIFLSYDRQAVELYRFIVFLIEDDKKDNCCCLAEIIKERLEV
jgi:hypothetical protein